MSPVREPETTPTTLGRGLVVSRYAPGHAQVWDAFVRTSRNGTFLLERGYMDYHADRFVDYSLEISDTTGALVALLPADRVGDVVRSHAGLSYGGFVVGEPMTAAMMGEVFAAVRDTLLADGTSQVVYKTIPTIYHASPADEDLYWLFRYGARLYRRDVLSVVEYARRQPVQERRERAFKKARRAGVTVRDTDDFGSFWAILDANLRTRYGVSPVHSAPEIKLLASRFPEAIRLVCAYSDGEIVAGAVVYVSREVCHVQYNAASESGKKQGGLDVVLEHLLASYAERVRFFDFGACTEHDGRYLNAGLVEYKESFGARTVVHDMYGWDLTVDLVER